jgi:hypothetical protein
MNTLSDKNRVSFAGRTISFRTAVHLIADARREPIGRCAQLLGMSKKDLALLEKGRWRLTPEIVGNTEGLLASTFG